MKTKSNMMQKGMLLAMAMAFVFGALPMTVYAQDQVGTYVFCGCREGTPRERPG